VIYRQIRRNHSLLPIAASAAQAEAERWEGKKKMMTKEDQTGHKMNPIVWSAIYVGAPLMATILLTSFDLSLTTILSPFAILIAHLFHCIIHLQKEMETLRAKLADKEERKLTSEPTAAAAASRGP
jgi:hypothetical protein